VVGDKQPGVKIDLEHAIDAPLVERDVFVGGHRHERVGSERFRIDPGRELPFLPTVVVLGGRQTEGVKRLRAGESFVAPFAGEKATQERVIRLPNHDQGVALLLNDQDPSSYREWAPTLEPLSTLPREVSRGARCAIGSGQKVGKPSIMKGDYTGVVELADAQDLGTKTRTLKIHHLQENKTS